MEKNMPKLMPDAKTKKTRVYEYENKDEIVEGIFNYMREGMGSYKACEKMGIAQSTFHKWVEADPKLKDTYARAREDLIERIAHEILEISDQDVELTGDGKRDWAAIAKHKLQVDTRKWLLSKLAPKRYGEKLEISGDQDSPLKIEKIERVVIDQKTREEE